MGIIIRGKRRALKRLHAAGITILDTVRVTPNYWSAYSYCLGYAPRDKIEIRITGSRVWDDFWGRPDERGITRTLVHEYGHAFLFKVWDALTAKERRRFEKLFGAFHEDTAGLSYVLDMLAGAAETLGFTKRTYSKHKHVSVYATVNAHEDWAEIFEHLNTNRLNRRLSKTLNEKVSYMKALIKKYGNSTRLVSLRS